MKIAILTVLIIAYAAIGTLLQIDKSNFYVTYNLLAFAFLMFNAKHVKQSFLLLKLNHPKIYKLISVRMNIVALLFILMAYIGIGAFLAVYETPFNVLYNLIAVPIVYLIIERNNLLPAIRN